MIICGVDPGLSGGIAIFNDNLLLAVHDMPKMAAPWGKGNLVDTKLLAEIVSYHKPEICHLERSQPMTGGGQNKQRNTGVNSVFSMGMSYMAVIATMEIMQVPVNYIWPASWTKHFGVVGKSKKGKHAEDVVKNIYPEAQIYGPQGGLKDGRCDAILIALFGGTKPHSPARERAVLL